jgi:hypothetical protein
MTETEAEVWADDAKYTFSGIVMWRTHDGIRAAVQKVGDMN